MGVVSEVNGCRNGNRFFLSFEAKYPNPEIKKGKAGCFAVADFWKEIGGMSKTDALAQLENGSEKSKINSILWEQPQSQILPAKINRDSKYM
jgi:hypothetical protein